jgi:hypothetical protein
MPDAQVRGITRENMYKKYRYFAFVHYYTNRDIKKARSLLWLALRQKPCLSADTVTLLFWYLPASLKNLARKIKHRLYYRSISEASL